jgi:hypothetical protein
MSIERLRRLAAHYGVAVEDLLPLEVSLVDRDVIDVDALEAAEAEGPLVIDLDRLDRLDRLEDPDARLLSRLVTGIRHGRARPPGRSMTIRSEDLRTIAALFDTVPHAARKKLLQLTSRETAGRE